MATNEPQSATKDHEPVIAEIAEPVVDYKKQYESAAKISEKATRNQEAAIAQLSAEKQAHEATRNALERQQLEYENLNKTIKQREAELSQLQGQVQQLEPAKNKAMRLEVIVSDFPELIPFEKDGLLPQGDTPEALRESLKKFSDRLAAHTIVKDAKFTSGGKPENIPAPEQKKGFANRAKDFLEAAIKAQKSGNMAEYEQNFSKYLQEKNKQEA